MAEIPEIEHVIVLALENRSFDHMLGFLDHPKDSFDGLAGAPRANPAWRGRDDVPAEPAAKPVLPVDPDHSHDAVLQQLAMRGIGPRRRPTNAGFVASYERKGRGLAAPSFGGLLGPLLNWWTGRQGAGAEPVPGRGPLIMHCQPPDRVPVLGGLALEFAVCTRWFCSVPGETWPNRNYMHAATSDGETGINIRAFNDPTIFELLSEHGKNEHAKTWRVYHDDTPQVWAFPKLWNTPRRHARWFPLAAFAEHATAGDLPAYSFLEPNHRPPVHTPDRLISRGASNSQHPGNNHIPDENYDAYPERPADEDTDFARGEALIASVYEALRGNPDLFARSLLLITYDEHGGFYDHVPPPTGVPAPGDPISRLARLTHMLYYRKAAAFDFTMLGPRVPAVVVSPFIRAGTVDAEPRDHASIPATLRALFAPEARPLTARDDWATPFHTLRDLPEPRTDLPDLSAHTGRGAAPAALAEPSEPFELAGQPIPESLPAHYAPFARQGDLVRQELKDVEEPEAAELTARPPAPQRAADITAAFAEAAHRHRTN